MLTCQHIESESLYKRHRIEEPQSVVIEEPQSLVEVLPPEIIHHIFSYLLDAPSLLSSLQACRITRDIIKTSPQLYRRMLKGFTLKKILNFFDTVALNDFYHIDNKNRILGEIAEKQALRDHVQALHAASLITDNGYKATAICTIAKVQTNSKQADELFSQAFEIANLIKDRILKQRKFADLVLAQIEINLEQAMFSANLVDEDTPWKPKIMSKTVKTLMRTNQECAVTMASCIRKEEQRINALSKIAKMQALTNLEQALVIANTIKNSTAHSFYRCKPFIKIAKVLKDPKQIDALCLEAFNIALLIEDEDQKPKDLAILKIIEAQAETNADQALKRAQLIKEKAIRNEAFTKIALAQATTNPEQARNIAHLIRPSRIRDRSLVQITCAQVLTNLKEAQVTAQLIKDLAPGPDSKVDAFIEIAKAQTSLEQAKKYFDQALLMVHSLPADFYKGGFFTKIAQAQAFIDPDQAITTANLIKNKYKKIDALIEIAKVHPIAEQASQLFTQAIHITKTLKDKPKFFKPMPYQVLVKIARAHRNAEIANQLFAQTIETAYLRYQSAKAASTEDTEAGMQFIEQIFHIHRALGV